jgi:hypothetical protein
MLALVVLVLAVLVLAKLRVALRLINSGRFNKEHPIHIIQSSTLIQRFILK